MRLQSSLSNTKFIPIYINEKGKQYKKTHGEGSWLLELIPVSGHEADRSIATPPGRFILEHFSQTASVWQTVCMLC